MLLVSASHGSRPSTRHPARRSSGLALGMYRYVDSASGKRPRFLQLGQGPAEQRVAPPLRTGERCARRVAEEQRVVGTLEVAVPHGHLELVS